MERGGVILAALLVATPASASWVQDWFAAPQQQQERAVEREQKAQQIEQERCATNLKRYEQALEGNPNSSYYKWKLEIWKKRCGKE